MTVTGLFDMLLCVTDRMGESVKPLTKGKLSAYAGPVEQMFSPAHVTMSFSQKHEIRETIIRDKVCQVSLACKHKTQGEHTALTCIDGTVFQCERFVGKTMVYILTKCGNYLLSLVFTNQYIIVPVVIVTTILIIIIRRKNNNNNNSITCWYFCITVSVS